LVWMLEGLGIDTGVDLAKLVEASRWLAIQLSRPSPSRVVAALGIGTPAALVSLSWVGGAQMAAIDDFDLDRSTAQAWAEFQSRLSEVISVIDDTADLTIGTESEGNGPPPFVRLSSPRPGVIRCEAASNAMLGDDFQLSAELLDTMERLGWQPPTTGEDQTSAAQVIQPLANFWVELSQIESDRMSELAV